MSDEDVILSDLYRLLSYWQERLSLQSWKINIQLTTSDNVQGLGSISWDTELCLAYIKVLYPKCYTNKDELFGIDLEEVLVHELLHLHFWFSSKSYNEFPSALEHRALTLIARALVGTRRENKDVQVDSCRY